MRGLLVDSGTADQSAEGGMLADMNRMVADLCLALGDDPDKVPCDIWRLKEHVDWLCEIKVARKSTLADLVTVLKRDP